MQVIVVVTVQSQGILGVKAEKRSIGWRGGDGRRCSFTADVTVQADHAVGLPHDHMQVMADQQHRTFEFLPTFLDQPVKGGYGRRIEALCGFIQNQNVRFAEKRLGQEHSLELPPRQVDHLPIGAVCNSNALQQGSRLGSIRVAGQRQEPGDCYGHCVIN